MVNGGSRTSPVWQGGSRVLYAALAGINLLAWGWALLAFHGHPVLLATALLAYTFGLRHAVDADHITAIDNVTRKLMQQGHRSPLVGLFFSLGHSTVVVALTLVIAISAGLFRDRFDVLEQAGSVVGTGISACFLFAIAIANGVVLIAVYRVFVRVKAGGCYTDDELDRLLAGRGMLSRLFRRLFRLIGRSWHMYPLGILFGLGFDTATEVGLLGISAVESSRGLSAWSMMVFPALFTAGMSLVDTLDGTLMRAAYDWAFAKPVRKLYYNMAVTFISVLIAALVGSIEVFALLAAREGLQGPFWGAMTSLDDHFGAIGFIVVGLFAASWAVSVAVYRIRRYDEVDTTT